MMAALKASMIAVALIATAPGLAGAAEGVAVPHYEWEHTGPFGTINKAAAQRGYQVYRQICASCHAMDLMYFRNLEGIGYTPDQVKALAAEVEVQGGPDEWGEMFYRPASPSDRFPNPWPNDEAAAASNGGVVPPDLSVIAKGRVGGENYLTAVLVGYEEPPEGVDYLEGKYYNEYFPGHWIGMPQMLYDQGIEYQDGTEATALQQAKDVSTFLYYAAEPHHDRRKELGVRVMLFLVVFAALMFATKRQLWSSVKH